MKRNKASPWPWLIALGIGGAAFLAFRAARAGATTRTKQVEDPVTGTTMPLRPNEPRDDAPELAMKIHEFMDSLDDEQLDALRKALPPEWWGHISAAAGQPTDALVEEKLAPVIADVQSMTSDEQAQLRNDVISAIGFIDAYRLNDLLQETGVV